MAPILSILTPAVLSRVDQLTKLCEHVNRQIILNRLNPQIEHLVLIDNKTRPVGAKRQALLDIARGDYVAFVDDDDWISDDYASELIARCESGPDVITFEQEAIIDGVSGKIIFDATCKVDEPWRPSPSSQPSTLNPQPAFARRRPWHLCAWRRHLAQQCVFTEVNYGEDRAWVDQVAPLAKTHLHIPKVLHYYRHSSSTTEAPAP